MALVHFVVIKVENILTLFVDGELVSTSLIPETAKFDEKFYVRFPCIYGASPELVYEDGKYTFYVDDVIENQSVETDDMKFTNREFAFEAMGNIRLPNFMLNDDDLSDMFSDGDARVLSAMLKSYGYPKTADIVRGKLSSRPLQE